MVNVVGVSFGRKIFFSVSFWKVSFVFEIGVSKEDFLLIYFVVIVNVGMYDV